MWTNSNTATFSVFSEMHKIIQDWFNTYASNVKMYSINWLQCQFHVHRLFYPIIFFFADEQTLEEPEWSEWSDWTLCRCEAPHQQTRGRHCLARTGVCAGYEREVRECTPQGCEGMVAYVIDVNALYQSLFNNNNS